MNYKEEMDALTAPEDLKKRIAALNQNLQKSHNNIGKIVAAVAAVLVVVFIAGFVAVPSFSMKQAAQDNGMTENTKDYLFDSDAPDEYAEENGFFTSSSSDAMAPNLPLNRKLIRNASLNIQTKDFDTFCTEVQKKIKALKGYVQSTDISDYPGSTRSATMVVRIPSDSLDSFLSQVSTLGTITWQSTDVKDVTDEYIDVQSRIEALETEQTALLDLLKNASSLSDILEIQDRLSEVRGHLESYKGQKKALDSQIDYSTVTMVVSEVKRIVQPEQQSFFAQVRSNLSDNLYSIGQAFRNFALSFLSNLPYILLWALGIGVVVVVVLCIRRRKRR